LKKKELKTTYSNQAQRERFRKRNEELEEEHSRLGSQLVALQSEVSDLQADNVKLYEKIKFLQGFQVCNQL
jgi:homeobox protein cut-like